MLRIERIFEAASIDEELAAYNPLIPDGRNWKATFMLEFPDVEERRVALERLVGIEDTLWMQVNGHAKVKGIADEDLDRTREAKTSAVHFVRFELTEEMATDLKAGAALSIGVDLPAYQYARDPLDEASRNALAADIA